MSSARRVGDGLRRLRVLAAASPLRISVLAASSLIGALAEAAILVLLVRIGVALAAGDDVVVLHLLGTHRLTIGQLLLIGFALVLPRAGLQVLGAWITARIAADTLVRLRTATYDRYTEATWATQSIEQDGHLQEVLTSHVNQLVNASVVVATGMISLLGFLALLLTAFIVNAAGALLIIVSVTLLFVGLRPLARIARRRSNDARRANLGYVHEVSETAALAQEARVFDVGEEQRRRAAARVQSVARAMLQGQFIGRLVPGLYQSIAVIAMLFGLWAIFAIGGTSIASLGASVLLLVRALTYGQGLQSTYHQLNELVPYADSVLDTQHRYEVARFERSGRPLEPIERFAFEDVWFSYVPGRPVLRGISFEAERGVAIGVVGPSGSGKSSLLQVLLRLRPVDEGRYTVNGEDAASYAADSWAEHVAFVPQEPRLMAGSVADNIRFLREGISDAEVEAAARAAQLHDEIMGWADGYATPIGDRGASISGGQRQRLALARALVRRPNLLVLDEPTSALDVHSEALIEETLEGLKGSTTIFVVAHRLSTLGMCDRIMVLRDGLVECFEEPARVLESNEYYREGVTLWQLH